MRAPGALWRLLDGQPKVSAGMAERLGIGEATDGTTARDAALRRVESYAAYSPATIGGYVRLNRSELRRGCPSTRPSASRPSSNCSPTRRSATGRARPCRGADQDVVSRRTDYRTAERAPCDAPLVHYQLHGKVAVLTIDRPGRHNAWTFEVEEGAVRPRRPRGFR